MVNELAMNNKPVFLFFLSNMLKRPLTTDITAKNNVTNPKM